MARFALSAPEQRSEPGCTAGDRQNKGKSETHALHSQSRTKNSQLTFQHNTFQPFHFKTSVLHYCQPARRMPNVTTPRHLEKIYQLQLLFSRGGRFSTREQIKREALSPSPALRQKGPGQPHTGSTRPPPAQGSLTAARRCGPPVTAPNPPGPAPHTQGPAPPPPRLTSAAGRLELRALAGDVWQRGDTAKRAGR